MGAPADRPAHERFRPSIQPRFARLPADPDVIVVGAGAAGIAATRELVAAGLSAVVLEARDRVGGRALTTLLRGHPIDLGAHWLHAGSINPLVALGRKRGEPLRRAPQDGHLVIGRRFGRPDERSAFAHAFDRADRAVTCAAAEEDRPASTAVPPILGPWRDRILRVHALVSGRPLDEVSLYDWPSLEYANNHFVAGGYGAYLARLAQGLPIAPAAPVTRIDWSGPGVRVETQAGGSFRARAAIVTIPIMAFDAIRFTPELPDSTRHAIDGFRPGHYEHVVLHWPSAPFHGRDRLASIVGGRLRPPGLLTCIDGAPFHYLELDVPNLRRVDAHRDAPDAARRLARDILAEHFGRTSIRDLAIPAVTEWRRDPWSRGAWAVVPPGHSRARASLRAPLAERVWFAGEALSREQWGTVGGAYAEGGRAAREIAARLAGRA